MLFHSNEFIFIYLPITLGVYIYLSKTNKDYCMPWLGAASVVFYGIWNPLNLVPLSVSILCNYGFGWLISKEEEGRKRKGFLTLSIILNLLLLGYFKYTNFLIETSNMVFGRDDTFFNIVLPLGISFFTFTQIAFLVDTYHRKCREYRIMDYVLFVTYFPHLIAGPIIHHKEMMPQFRDRKNLTFKWEWISLGLTLFILGLFKKKIIADSLVPYVSTTFGQTASGYEITFFEAWFGALSYTLQLYFDFSGYCDMAMGLSKLFGIRLPLNFNSPYQATSIIDFWRRWHMTLSRFLRDYIYIPLGGNRKGDLRKHGNILMTMFLGGIWHGAGLNFIVWGLLHGFFLSFNHGWRFLTGKLGLRPTKKVPGVALLSQLFTYFCVVIAWVFFRAQDTTTAWTMVRGMFGANGLRLPHGYLSKLGRLGDYLQAQGVEFTSLQVHFFSDQLLWIVTLTLACWFLPNTAVILRNVRSKLMLHEGVQWEDARNFFFRRLLWKSSRGWSFFMAFLVVICLWLHHKATEFLYFQF